MLSELLPLPWGSPTYLDWGFRWPLGAIRSSSLRRRNRRRGALGSAGRDESVRSFVGCMGILLLENLDSVAAAGREVAGARRAAAAALVAAALVPAADLLGLRVQVRLGRDPLLELRETEALAALAALRGAGRGVAI